MFSEESQSIVSDFSFLSFSFFGHLTQGAPRQGKVWTLQVEKEDTQGTVILACGGQSKIEVERKERYCPSIHLSLYNLV